MKQFLYLKIYNDLKEKILKNHFTDNKLPSTRALTKEYLVSSRTISKSLELLEINGYINIIPSKGIYIKNNTKFKNNKKIKTILKNYKKTEIKTNKTIDFSKSEIDSSFFNKFLYQKLLKEIFSSEDFVLNDFKYIQGLPSFINFISEWIESDNIFVHKDNIFSISRTQQCLEIIMRSFYHDKKLNIAVSDPTHYNTITLLEPFANIHGVHLLDDGWDFHDFENILNQYKIDFVYEAPNFQNPSGISWSVEKKLHLLNLANKHDFYIIEEDNLSDFFYNINKPITFKSLDKIGNERVFYIKDFSKIISNELQVALLIVPTIFKEKISLEIVSLEASPSNISQKIIELFIRNNHMNTFIKKYKKKLETRHNYALYLLKKIPYLKIMHVPYGGFFIWLQLKTEIDEELFYTLCKIKGVLILPGYIFYQDRRKNSKFRICFLSTDLEKIHTGINIIKNILSKKKLRDI